jgi:hypothetical protein
MKSFPKLSNKKIELLADCVKTLAELSNQSNYEIVDCIEGILFSEDTCRTVEQMFERS